LDSPALAVYPARVQQNIDTLIAMIDDVSRLRPHVKTNKCAEVVQMMRASRIYKFKCATIAEAELLGLCGAEDVLLAYQPIGPKLQRFKALVKRYPATGYSCLVDDSSAATAISATFATVGYRLPVYLDLNIGMNRTGIAPDKVALDLYLALNDMRGVLPLGLHAYDGHLRDPDLNTRMIACDAAFESVQQLSSAIISAGLPEPVIVAGGSPTYSIHAKRPKVECSPGTFIYWDEVCRHICAEQPFIQAAVLIARVISLPDRTKICVDLGHKSVAAENELSKRVFFLNAPELIPLSQSEEHLVLEAGEDHPYQVGDLLYGLAGHICPTVALYEEVVAVKDHHMTGVWKNAARDRTINI
jgi:D-serine deaminase-like pyridoxal phosphate-dependent protein